MQTLITDFENVAASIPSMGGRRIGPFLRRVAQRCQPDTHIVEVGAWLGAGTAQLMLGILARENPKDVTLHVYDRFIAGSSEIEKMRTKGVFDIDEGEDTLPWVKDKLSAVMNDLNVKFHKGDINDVHWNRSDVIGVYVDDASKAKFPTVFSKFGPSLMKGSYVVLMDFNYFKMEKLSAAESIRHRAQRDFIEARASSFENVSTGIPEGTSSAAFIYRGGASFEPNL